MEPGTASITLTKRDVAVFSQGAFMIPEEQLDLHREEFAGFSSKIENLIALIGGGDYDELTLDITPFEAAVMLFAFTQMDYRRGVALVGKASAIAVGEDPDMFEEFLT